MSWEDASGPEYDANYRKKADDDPWTAPPGLEDEDLIYSKTHVNLVRNKRHRQAREPQRPGAGVTPCADSARPGTALTSRPCQHRRPR